MSKTIPGDLILSTLKEIVKETLEGASKKIPHEGEERAFRGWLISHFLHPIFDWPIYHVMQGERYDLNLLGVTKMPIVTIETKPPGHIIRKKDYNDFFKRLPNYKFKVAFITNGATWERFDIEKPLLNVGEITKSSFSRTGLGEQSGLFEKLQKDKIGHSYYLDINRASVAEAEVFFTSLAAHIYLGVKPEEVLPEDRNPVSKKYPPIVTGFTQQLQQEIGEFVDILNAMFIKFRNSECGDHQKTVTVRLFGEWCRKSYVLPPQDLIEKLLSIQTSNRTPEFISQALKGVEFPTSESSLVADQILTQLKEVNWTAENLLPMLWMLYNESISTFLTQTAHVFVARLLLYRVGEDRGIFDKRLWGDPLKKVISSDSKAFESLEPKGILHIRELQRHMKVFSSTVYTEGDFDWWQVNDEERTRLSYAERRQLSDLEKSLNTSVCSLLQMLAWYDFSEVDVDVWRNIYQHYLPEDERQRLGGFYTPDELIELILDLAGYKADEPDLCKKSFIDLTSGSGAFVVECLHRLLRHLKNPDLPCHSHLYNHEVMDYVRSEEILRIVEKNLHAVDIHPFASFLTYVNTLFVVLDDYKKVHDQDTQFRIDFKIFSANSLLKASQQAISPEMFNQANSRIQASLDSLERYKNLIAQRFDFVVGNPPWGGILKGKLAPIFDDQYKTKLALEFQDTYTGKLDIYGLFIDKGLSLLKENGRLGLITQGSYIDKEWASPSIEHISAKGSLHEARSREIKGLRRLLAEDSNILYIVDLNPFGQLFFNAMNIPCITVTEKCLPALEGSFNVVLSKRKTFPKESKPNERRRYVIDTVRHSLKEGQEEPYSHDFASAFPFPRQRLADFNGGRWLLFPEQFEPIKSEKMYCLKDLLEPRQGVTPGGCLDVFLMDKDKVKTLKLEDELVHKAIKSKQIKRWTVEWQKKYLLYPYKIKGKDAVPVFAVQAKNLKDALDYDFIWDEDERSYRKMASSEKDRRDLILKHRQAKGIIAFPNAAKYLTEHYEVLSARVFEKKTFSAMGKKWYEYHRARDHKLMLSKYRIVSPSLSQRVRFALDTKGYLSDHACQYLLITPAVEERFKEFSSKLAKIAGKKKVGIQEVLMYLLAFLNSSYAQKVFTIGHRPRPGDVYQVSEEFFGDMYVPLPKTAKEYKDIIKGVERCMQAKGNIELANAEKALDKHVMKLYKSVKPRKSKAKSKHRKPKK